MCPVLYTILYTNSMTLEAISLYSSLPSGSLVQKGSKVSPQTGQRMGLTGPSGCCAHDPGLAEHRAHAQSILLPVSVMWVWKPAAYFYSLLGNIPQPEL